MKPSREPQCGALATKEPPKKSPKTVGPVAAVALVAATVTALA